LHQNFGAGKGGLSCRLPSKLGNIGSEVGRARLSRGKDEAKFWDAAARALDLFYLTLSDKRWSAWRKKEICRACETFCDALLGGKPTVAIWNRLTVILPVLLCWQCRIIKRYESFYRTKLLLLDIFFAKAAILILPKFKVQDSKFCSSLPTSGF